jgi:hypothetical protein
MFFKLPLLMLFSLFCLNKLEAQKSIVKTSGPVQKIQNIDANGFLFFYSVLDFDQILYKTYSIENKKMLTIENYSNLDLNLISKEKKIGNIYFNDTIRYPLNINSKIVNELLGQMLSNSNLNRYNQNSYGLYYFDVTFYFSFFNKETFNYKLFVKENEIILECNQYMNFFTYEHQATDETELNNDFYNSEFIGKHIKENGEIRFRKEKAYKQLVNISIYNDVRDKIRSYFKDYIYEVNDQINAIKL